MEFLFILLSEILFFLNRMHPTPKEKDTRAYDVAMAKVALGTLTRQGKPVKRRSEDDEREFDTRRFASLKWKEDMKAASKRRKIENRREEEIIRTKAYALRGREADVDSEAEESDIETQAQQAQRLQSEVAIRKVKDVQTPSELLNENICKFLCTNVFSNFRNIF